MPQLELKKYLATADAYIFPSLEPFGIAPLEAMSAGCPVIAFAVGGAADYIIENQNGTTFKSQTVSSLVATLKNFDSKKFQPAKVSASVQKFSNERFQSELKNFVKEKYANH